MLDKSPCSHSQSLSMDSLAIVAGQLVAHDLVLHIKDSSSMSCVDPCNLVHLSPDFSFDVWPPTDSGSIAAVPGGWDLGRPSTASQASCSCALAFPCFL